MHLHLWGICFIINGSKIHTGSHFVMVLHKANNSACFMLMSVVNISNKYSRGRLIISPFPSTRHHLSYDNGLEDDRKLSKFLCCVVYNSGAQ